MGSKWYVARDCKTYGPFTPEEMSAGVRDNELRRDDLVWCEGMPQWQPSGEVPGLWPPPNLPPPPAPAPVREQARSPAVVAQDSARGNVQPLGEGQAGAVQKAPRRAGFIVRHWRGELTLAQAYWGVGVLLGLVVVGLSHVFGAWASRANLSPVSSGIAMASFLVFLCVVAIWQLAGIWRAAGNHIRSTGRKGWARVARVAVVIGALRATFDFSTVVGPMLSESLMLATGRETIPAYRLRLLRGNTEVELAGGMPFGTADAVRRMLDAAPGVQVLHLNSTGGRVSEGYQIYQIIRDRNLATYTATDCVSACTIAFLGGSQRYLSTKAKLGFHSLSFGGVDQSRLPDINADLRAMLAKHGAPAWFIEKALSTSANSMWYPTNQDLFDAKIVTRVVDPDQFALSGVGNWSDKEGLERGLLSLPLYALIKDNDPDGFKELAGRFAEAVRLGKSGPELIEDVQSVLADKILPKYLRVAPDAASHRYWRSQVAEMEHLSRSDAALCVAFTFPERRAPGFNLNKLVPPALLAEDIAALTDLVGQAIRTPHTQKPKNIDEEFDGVFGRISARIPGAQDILGQPTKFLDQPRVLCDALVAFYTDILSLPPSRSGPMLRALAEPLP
jgi:hypothetical protein